MKFKSVFFMLLVFIVFAVVIMISVRKEKFYSPGRFTESPVSSSGTADIFLTVEREGRFGESLSFFSLLWDHLSSANNLASVCDEIGSINELKESVRRETETIHIPASATRNVIEGFVAMYEWYEEEKTSCLWNINLSSKSDHHYLLIFGDTYFHFKNQKADVLKSYDYSVESGRVLK